MLSLTSMATLIRRAASTSTTDDPAENDLPIEFIYAAWTAKSDTQSFYDGLPADTTAEGLSGTANKAGVNVLVDGNPNTTGDIYAVGDGVVTNGPSDTWLPERRSMVDASYLHRSAHCDW